MRVKALMQELRDRGVVLTADGDRLHYRAPKEALSNELLAAMKEHKLELIRLLRSNPLAQSVVKITNQNGHEEWDFEPVILPNGDRWMIGRRTVPTPAELCWFIGGPKEAN